MYIPSKTRPWPRTLLAAALSILCASSAAAQMQMQTRNPSSTLRLVSETPGTPAPQRAPAISADELADIAGDAYVYAYPLVLMEVTRRIHTNVASALEGRAPMNQFGHRTVFPDANTSDAYWPSTDSVYSNLWFDVSRNPLIINLPDSGERYRMLTFLDMWTDQFATLGTRTTGNGRQQVALVGPYWNGTLPPNIESLRSPTAMGWIIGRVQVAGSADLAAANQFQAALSATPWAPLTVARTDDPAYPTARSPSRPGPGAFAPVTAPTVNPNWDMSTAPAEQVARMDAAQFFTLFSDVVRNNPPHANDYPILARMRRIGIGGTYRPFNFALLDPAVQQALADAGPQTGRRITDAVAGLALPVNGWMTVLHGIGTYGTDYTRRAAIAYAGLGANTPEDVIYPVTMSDADGKPLDGSEKYILHFDTGQLPPVDAFWSVIAYNPNHGFVANAAKRYAIRSTDALKYNADGSLDLYVQSRNPGRDRQANWLPTPEKGNFLLNMRLYSPKSIALDGRWAPPPLRN